METIFSLLILLLIASFSFSQTKRTELFDLIKELVADSAEISTSGDWAVGRPST